MRHIPVEKESKTVSFGEKLAESQQFMALFEEGMTLVSRAAAYLDGEGRAEAKRLSRPAAVTYAVESMRLTTRLMQIASWLLLQRAVNEGELSRAEAADEKRRIHLTQQDSLSTREALAGLPERLRELIATSLRLQARIIHLDVLIYKSHEARAREFPPQSPAKRQFEELRTALGALSAPQATA